MLIRKSDDKSYLDACLYDAYVDDFAKYVDDEETPYLSPVFPILSYIYGYN